MRKAGGFGVFATEDEQGPEVRFCGYVPTRHRQTNNRAELWAALEALQGFWVPKLAILTDSQYLQLGATGRAQHWKSKGWMTTSDKVQVHVPVWEMLLQEMAKPGREVRWEHVPAHVNVQFEPLVGPHHNFCLCVLFFRFFPLWMDEHRTRAVGVQHALRHGPYTLDLVRWCVKGRIRCLVFEMYQTTMGPPPKPEISVG